MVAVSLVPLLGMSGFVIDLGVWYQAHRQQQSIADAAALAGAGALPASTSVALADAQTYAMKNDGSAAAGDITFSTKYLANDTITVVAPKTVPTTFLKVLGISNTTVRATAVARAENLGAAWGAAPFGIINTQSQLAGPGCPCLQVPTTLDLAKVGPGGFKIINIDGSSGGTSPGTLGSWIQDGCSCTMSAPVWLHSDPGAKFNSSQVKNAMDARIDSNLLFPVYDQTSGNGANLQYHVIGFAGFHVTDYTFKGNSGTISGYFVKVDWNGSGTNSGSNYFGATTTQLVDPNS